MKNKKGDMMNNMIGIVIAVIGLLLFSYAVVQLYKMNVDQEKENAKRVLNSIIGKIDALEDGERNTFPIQGIRGDKKWYLVGYEFLEKPLPEKCFLESCLCVCPGGGDSEGFINSCQNEGICRNIDEKILKVSGNAILNYLKSSDRTFGGLGPIHYENLQISGNCIQLSSNLFELNLAKEKSNLTIFRDYGIIEDQKIGTDVYNYLSYMCDK